ncbi:helix-turn-helix domain-containing protein [Luteimonas salinilitoris]|uniref:Helix-turn-helix domain-containing protein n=1 Tax=Luteimonas salinilitoris TaxID=3237697 RepID=A0ABV4HY69_9GAMM
MRQELVDTLYALGGEASVADLAQTLGHHADGLYYHLRLLRKAGLVEEIQAEPGAGLAYRLAGRGSGPLRLAYRTGGQGNTEALSAYVRGLLQVAGKDFEQALALPEVAVEGKRRQLWASRNKGWLSAAEIEEVNALLERLCELTSQPRSPGRDTLMTLVFALSPSLPRAKRR